MLVCLPDGLHLALPGPSFILSMLLILFVPPLCLLLLLTCLSPSTCITDVCICGGSISVKIEYKKMDWKQTTETTKGPWRKHMQPLCVNWFTKVGLLLNHICVSLWAVYSWRISISCHPAAMCDNICRLLYNSLICCFAVLFYCLLFYFFTCCQRKNKG